MVRRREIELTTIESQVRRPIGRDAESLFSVGLQLQLQNVMCDMLIVYFMMNGENLILLNF